MRRGLGKEEQLRLRRSNGADLAKINLDEIRPDSGHFWKVHGTSTGCLDKASLSHLLRVSNLHVFDSMQVSVTEPSDEHQCRILNLLID